MHTPSRAWIVVLCWLTVMFEGFDIVALGATIPILTNPEIGHLGVTAADMTFVSTISLVGVAIGAVCIGPIADRHGRRLPLMGCVALFSVFTLIFPLMPNVALMGAARLVAGFGLGACMPIAVTMMQESAPQGRKANASTVTMTGYHAGAVLASLAALVFHEHWHWLFYLGGGLGLVALVPMWLKLPETAPPTIVGTTATANATAGPTRPTAASGPTSPTDASGPSDASGAPAPPATKLGIRDLFRDGRARITVGLWAATFMGLMLVYGLNTWLPKIMELAGYNVSSSLVMLFILNAGGIIGLLVGGRVADARGIKGTILVWFGVAAVLLAALSIRIADQFVLNGIILVTGVFVFSAQVLVYAFVGFLYPKTLVATGMGFASGVGRLGAILGPLATGVLVTLSLAYPGGFYMFAAAALVGFLAILSIPKPRASTAKELHALEQAEAQAER